MRRLVTFFLVVLLLGALAAPLAAESPTTTEELLAGMITEEVEPGVYRVINDGVRDLARVTRDEPSGDIIAGPEGSVWLGDGDRRLRLGDADVYEDLSGWRSRYVVAPDGSLWSIADGHLHSLDGESWTERWDALGDTVSLGGIAAAPDGTIWVTGTGEAGETTGLYRFADAGPASASQDWSDVYPRAAGFGQVAVAGNGDVWLIGEQDADLPGYGDGGPTVDAFLRFDGRGWEVVEVPDDLRYVPEGQSFDIGSDGTLWAAVGNPSKGDDGLARLDDSGWTVFTEADGVRPWGLYGFLPTDHLHVAPDGSVWVNAEGTGVSCGGVARFDGAMWTGYLADRCVHDVDIAPDGAVWVRAGTHAASGGFEYWDSPDTYVITPEAGAAAGSSVEVSIEGLEGAAGSRLTAILYEQLAGPPRGLGAFSADITSDPFAVTDTIRDTREWWESTAVEPVLEVPAGTYALGIWVSSDLGPYSDWMPASPVEAGCVVTVTIREGEPTSIVIVDVPRRGAPDTPCGMRSTPEAVAAAE